jgi:hypothetical protein
MFIVIDEYALRKSIACWTSAVVVLAEIQLSVSVAATDEVCDVTL